MDWLKKMQQFEGEPVYDDLVPVTREYLDRVEQAVGAKLPLDYVEFILATGGTYGIFSAGVVARDGEETDIGVFFGGDEEKGYDLLTEIADYKLRIPGTLLPIARASVAVAPRCRKAFRGESGGDQRNVDQGDPGAARPPL
jgi:hypothetical protein